MKRASPRPRAAPGHSRPRASRARQRQRLIDACISALHVHGPSNTTVEKVVAIARMSPGIVRFYFDSKAAMLVASLEYLAEEFDDRLIVPVAELKSTPVAALERLVDLYLGPEIASARKVSVWYSFWGEASSRQEYYDICGKRDARFEALVRELIGRLIADTGARHLDADGIALGLIGALEMLWQGYAFQTESAIDRADARRRCMAYLRSVFPAQFAAPAGAPPRTGLPPAAYASAPLLEAERHALFFGSWQFVGLDSELAATGDYLTLEAPGTRALVLREPAGGLRAIQNSCPQRPHALVMHRAGHIDGFIACLVHNLRYDFSGEPQGDTPGGPLARLALAASDGLLFVRGPTDRDPAPPAPALAATSAASTMRLVAAGPPRETDVAADWKLLIERWLEWPGSQPASPAAPGVVEFAGDLPTSGTWREQRYLGLARQCGTTRWQRSYIAPNQLVDVRPGAVQVLQVLPLGPGRCRLRSFDYAPAPDGRLEHGLACLAARLGRRRLAADVALATSVQRGLESPGPVREPVSRVPAPLAEFRNIIARLLPGALRHPGDSP
ncbi:MAG TPA: TetR family transcriptional regulator C-terminal domain-containing protein [Steroidobacteraceae bacterium]|nr:TetR family transcriptional regulator C-terminal domain-containing protein [Steroidobacteraceae bacterium]